MKIIGLTGGTGSGKSLVSSFLKKNDFYIIDADSIGHDIIKKGNNAYNEIVKFFGEEILDENREIIRKKLGIIVFSDAEKLCFLDKCTHKYIRDEILKNIEIAMNELNYVGIIIDAPLLIEAGLNEMCDEIWVVCANEEVRINRIVNRDKITYEQAQNRIRSQKSLDEYKKIATHVIYNNNKIPFLKNQLKKLCENMIGG